MNNTFDYILRHFIMLTIYHWGVEGMKMWRSTFGQQHGQQCWLMYNISKFTDFLSLKEFVRKNIFLSNFHSKFQMIIESSFLRTIWTRPTVIFEIWNLQIKLVIDWKNTRFVPYKVLAWRTNYVFFIFITIDRKVGVHVTDVITFIRNTFPDLETIILYHISPHIFVHFLPTVRIIYYRFLDYK